MDRLWGPARASLLLKTVWTKVKLLFDFMIASGHTIEHINGAPQWRRSVAPVLPPVAKNFQGFLSQLTPYMNDGWRYKEVSMTEVNEEADERLLV